MLDADHLRQFKTLILPNISALSDAQCQQLRDFVERGGSVVATYETSLYDEWGARRKDFGLADLSAITSRAGPTGPMQNSYLRLESDPAAGRRHALLAGLEDAPRIINGVYRIEVAATFALPRPAPDAHPIYPDLPMEKVYPRVPKTDIAQVFLREVRQRAGRAIFPWDIDRTFWEVLCVDHGITLRNAVAWATDEEPPVRSPAPASSTSPPGGRNTRSPFTL